MPSTKLTLWVTAVHFFGTPPRGWIYRSEVVFNRVHFDSGFFDTRDGLTRAERVKRGVAGARLLRARTLDAFEHDGTLGTFETLAVSLSGK